MERFTITRTRRWGNADTRVDHVYSANRVDVKRDDVIRMANTMIEKETVNTNEEVEFEVFLCYDNGNIETIHRVDKEGVKSL